MADWGTTDSLIVLALLAELTRRGQHAGPRGEGAGLAGPAAADKKESVLPHEPRA